MARFLEIHTYHACLLLIAPFLATAQNSFNLAVDLGLVNNNFRHVIVHDDTIVGLGMARADTITWQQGLLVAKFDSAGSLLASTLLLDTLGAHLAVDRQWGKIARTSDGGYALTGATTSRRDAILFKLDASLQEEFRHEYTDTINLSNYNYKTPIELEDGYILYGSIQRPNFKNDPFARRVDRQGNTVWFRYYGETPLTHVFHHASLRADSTIVLAGGKTLNEREVTSLITIIGLDGEVIREWESARNPPIGALRRIIPLDDGGFITYGLYLADFIFDTHIVQPVLARLDSNFQLQWELRFGPVKSLGSMIELRDILPSADGNYLGAGESLERVNGIDHRVGWLFKFTPEGDSLWSRQYFPPFAVGEGPHISGWFGGFGELSSGNIVAGGFASQGALMYGWLLKTDAQGCLEGEPCELPTSAGEAPAAPGLAGLRAFPNPTSGHLSVELPEGYPAAAARLYSLHGRLAFQQRLTGGLNELYLPLPPGLYILEVELPHGERVRQKIVLAR
jgi:hypothetical protein